MTRQNQITNSLWMLAICCLVARADEFKVEFDSPGSVQFLDRWMYPFNITSGSRINASTFGAVGSEGFDDRDGQFLIAIDTTSLGIEPNLPSNSYQVESIVLAVTDSVGGYGFDGTYDRYQSYLETDNERYVADDDPGRPIELYGAGFRNGFEEFGWPDGGTVTEAPVFSAGSSFGPKSRSTRNVYAQDTDGNDVSNNVDSLNGGANGFDPTPFAVAQVLVNDEPLAAGREVPGGASLRFDVDLSDAGTLNYFQSSLAQGQLGLVLTSMHGTGVMGEGDPFPNPATANHFATSGPIFEIAVDVAPDLVEGDFDGDGELTVNDINQLTSEVLAETHGPAFDLTDDGLVDGVDRNTWVEDLFPTHFGDSNLDGEFNAGDLITVFQAGEYEDEIAMNSNWSTGDWNGDADFDTNDLVLVFQRGGFEQGPRIAFTIVPEPKNCCMLIVLSLFLIRSSRQAKV